MNAPRVQYVKTSDGFSIAFAVCGDGQPLVLVPPVLTHLQLVWEEDVRNKWLTGFASRYKLVMLDGRGTGLSTRGLPTSFTDKDRVLDLETVVERVGLERFVLLAVGTRCHTAVRFAAKHPEKVKALVLVSCSVTSEPWPRALMETMARDDWDTFFYVISQGGRSHEETLQNVENLKQRVDQADFMIMNSDLWGSSIETELAELSAPVLVIHPRNVKSPSYEDCSNLASKIANAQLVEIDGATPGRGVVHGLLGDPESGLAVVEGFLAELPTPEIHIATPVSLSSRQIEVMRLVGAAQTNPEIAENLVISLRTVKRHLSEIYAKIGARNRADAAIYALTHSLDT